MELVGAKREDLLEHYYSLQLTARQTETDILLSQSTNVEYALDYSAFYDGIARRSRPNNALDAVSGQLYSELVHAKSLPFTSYITGPTFLEVIDGFLRNIEHNKRLTAPEVTQRINVGYMTIQNIKGQADPGNGHILNLRQDYIERELVEIEALIGKRITDEILRARKLFGEGAPVKGLGDRHHNILTSLRLGNREIETKLSMLKEARWEKDSRSSEEKEFRYTVDAINIALVDALATSLTGSKVKYVTRSSQSQLLREGVGRTPVVPLYWLKAVRNAEFLSISEQADFFEMLASQARFVYNGIMARPSVPDGRGLIIEMAGVIEPLLSRLDGVDTPVNSKKETDEHYRLKDKLYAQEVRDRNISNAEQQVLRLWRDFNQKSADDLIERGGLERLDYYQKLNKRLRAISPN